MWVRAGGPGKTPFAENGTLRITELQPERTEVQPAHKRRFANVPPDFTRAVSTPSVEGVQSPRMPPERGATVTAKRPRTVFTRTHAPNATESKAGVSTRLFVPAARAVPAFNNSTRENTGTISSTWCV